MLAGGATRIVGAGTVKYPSPGAVTPIETTCPFWSTTVEARAPEPLEPRTDTIGAKS